MYKTCPKCGYQRTENDKSDKNTCPACGLIFSKYLKHRLKIPEKTAPTVIDNNVLTSVNLKDLLLHVSTPVDTVSFYVRCAVYVFFVIWGWQFINMDYYTFQIHTRIDDPLPEIGQSFMHNINLVFHEAGHILFIPFGRFMTVLGGSLFQVLVPLLVLLVFLIKEHNPFAASIGLWWLGQSLMDIAPYINDARNGQLILLGGTTGQESSGYHDWETLLTQLNWMHLDHQIADNVDRLGATFMLIAFVWGGFLLFKQYQSRH